MITIENEDSTLDMSHIRLFEMNMDILSEINPILPDIYKILITDLSKYSLLQKELYDGGKLSESEIDFMNIFSCLMDITTEFIPPSIHKWLFDNSEDNEFSPEFCEALFNELLELGDVDDNCSKLTNMLYVSVEKKIGLKTHNGDY